LATAPGQMVSVDQLESSAAGFISQLKGRLTRRRYKAATIFVDNFSRMSYVHLQESLTSGDTVEAKEAFEAFSRNMGVRIQKYHADNGIFADNALMNAVRQNQQTISFCGVNAHFQNGIAEKRIRHLQEQARTMLLHAKSRWSKGISIHLWPYALRSSNHLRQVSPDKEDGTSPLERFSGAKVAANLKDCHTPLCPVYALNSSLASGKSIPKWDNMCRLGINLGPSPRHARSVSLVLNLTTGLTSPQFHVKYDEFFETVASITGAPETISNWQSLAGFWMIKGRQVTEDVFLMPVRDEQRIVHQEAEQEPTQAEETAAAEPGSGTSNQALEVDALEESVPVLPPMIVGTRRSSRYRRPTARMLESVQQEGLAFAAESVDIQGEEVEERYYDAMHED
jgi:hypothetical protein